MRARVIRELLIVTCARVKYPRIFMIYTVAFNFIMYTRLDYSRIKFNLELGLTNLMVII